MSSSGNIKNIPRWKAQLLEKRKSATRLKADSIPSWKKELIKKIHENHKIGNEAKDIEDKAIISDSIVKVSQNIFVVRESKSSLNPRLQATKNKQQQQQQVKFNLTKPENIVIIEKSSENHEMNKNEDLPQQGLVNRLKSRFMENQTSFPDSLHKKSTFNIGRSDKNETKQETKIPLKHIGNTSKPFPKRSTSEIELFTDQKNDQDEIQLTKSWSRTPSVDILSPKSFKPTSDHQVKTPQLKSSSDVKKIQSKAPQITKQVSKPPNKVLDSNKKVAMTTSVDKWSRVELHDVKVASDKLGEQKARAYMEMMKGSRTFQIIPRGAKSEGPKIEKKSSHLPCTDIDEILEDTQDQKSADEEDEKEEEKKKVVAKLDSNLTPPPVAAPPVPAPPVPAPPVSAPFVPDSKFRASVNTATSLFGTKSVTSSGRSFTINPKKFKNSAAPPVEVKKEKPKEVLNAITIIPIKMKDTIIEEPVTKKTGRRKPGVDQIEVVGGYIKLAHSCLAKAKKKEKKSVRFNSKSQLNHYHQNSYEDYGNFNNNSNNNNRMFNRTNMYIPENERSLDNNLTANKSVEERDIKFEDKPTLAVKSQPKQIKSKFITFVDDYNPGSSSSSSSSSDDDDDLFQALPTAADDAAVFSDVTSNDLLF